MIYERNGLSNNPMYGILVFYKSGVGVSGLQYYVLCFALKLFTQL